MKQKSLESKRNLALQLALMRNPKNLAMSMRGVSKNYMHPSSVFAAKHGKLLIEWAKRGKLEDVRRMVSASEFKIQKNTPAEYKTLIREVCCRAFVAACKEDQQEVSHFLMTLASEPVPRVDPTCEDNLPIQLACYNNDTELCRLLLTWRGPAGERVDPTDEQQTQLRQAVMNNNPDIVDLLLDWRSTNPAVTFVDPRVDENILLRKSASKGYYDIVLSLLRWRHTVDGVVLFVDPRAADSEALKVADRKDHHGVVTLLLAWEGPNDERLDPTVLGRGPSF